MSTLFYLTKVWTIFKRYTFRPAGAWALGRYSVTIHISPRWGCALVHPSLFFAELCFCEKLKKNTQPLENSTHTEQELSKL